MIVLERSDPFAMGRMKGGGTTYYCAPGWVFSGIGTQTHAVNFDYYEPFYVSTPVRVDQLALEVTSAGNQVRIGMYRADRNWQPIGAPLVDSGAIATDSTGIKTYAPSTPLFLSRGRYLGVRNVNTGTAFRALLGFLAVGPAVTDTPFQIYTRVARTYGAFPTPGTPWDSTASSSTPFQYCVFYRVVNP